MLGICAVHRVKDISGGTSNSPVISFGTVLDIIGVDIWLPDGHGYKDKFTVDDTGLGRNRTDYWIDIYYHKDIPSAKHMASKNFLIPIQTKFTTRKKGSNHVKKEKVRRYILYFIDWCGRSIVRIVRYEDRPFRRFF
ncbi:hypothetical protein [Dehalobacterium formicoaceticum]|uniref:hypothetical protein n=1 Tax=Dehalobacterium formicoaceticum TaxID=51515 RepID=UPI0031F657DC